MNSLLNHHCMMENTPMKPLYKGSLVQFHCVETHRICGNYPVVVEPGPELGSATQFNPVFTKQFILHCFVHIFLILYLFWHLISEEYRVHMALLIWRNICTYYLNCSVSNFVKCSKSHLIFTATCAVGRLDSSYPHFYK